MRRDHIRQRLGRSIRRRPGGLASAIVAALALIPLHAQAQRAGENVVTSAEDAFGVAIGNEKIGIYNDQDVRGFSPVRAGNVRLDGAYLDQVAATNSRMRSGSSIRVGTAALDYPFPAPTGIVDFHLRTSGDEPMVSLGVGRQPYGAFIAEVDAQIPIVRNRLTLAAGVASDHQEYPDGASVDFLTLGLVPRLTFERGEIIPVIGVFTSRGASARPVIVTHGAFVPHLPKQHSYLGQPWSEGSTDSGNVGLITRLALDGGWSLQASGFDSFVVRRRTFSEIFTVERPDGSGRHRVVADPEQLNRSYAGELQLAWKRQGPHVRHSLLFMVRGRDRLNETGGSDARELGAMVLGAPDPEPRPDFRFGPVDEGRIRQVAGAVGYVGQLAGVGQINFGLQKAHYRATFERQGLITTTSQAPWLPNAALVLTPRKGITLYSTYVRGLEDSGVAPENAANRNEQLAASLTTQVDGGVRLAHGRKRLVVSAFSISKPYFSFDAANRYAALGDVRHSGLEASFSGEVGHGLNLLAGAVLMNPVVTGEARDSGRVGKRPVNTTRRLLRFDADYASPIEGLSFSVAVVHAGPRTASTRTYAELGGRQLRIPALTTVDLGFRYRFRMGETPMSFRILASNVFDQRSWKVAAANSYQLNDARRVLVYLVGDF